MTTHTTVSRIRHDSDATFREWMQEFEAALSAIGLTQTSDTGQINTATAVRPGTNTSAGYQIWRFNDTQQGSRPIFMRIEYGTGGSTTNPRISMGIGTGTNGAGTLTGVTSAVVSLLGSGAQTSDTNRNSYWCYVDGCFGFHYKVGAASTEHVTFVCRTVDNTGAASATGFIAAHFSLNQFRGRVFDTLGAVVETTNVNVAQLCHWPMSISNSFVGADYQVATMWAPMPRYTPFVGAVGVLDTEAAQGTTFSFTGVGTTARTYLATNGGTPYMTANNNLKPAILWE